MCPGYASLSSAHSDEITEKLFFPVAPISVQLVVGHHGLKIRKGSWEDFSLQITWHWSPEATASAPLPSVSADVDFRQAS